MSSTDDYLSEMSRWKLYSKREQSRRNPQWDDVLRYDEPPQDFRNQVLFIWGTAIGRYGVSSWRSPLPVDYAPNTTWSLVYGGFCRYKGMPQLTSDVKNPQEQCYEYLLTASVEDALDLIEFAFRVIDRAVRSLGDRRRKWQLSDPDVAIAELNERFREHGIGYEYVGEQVVRIDSTLIHAEAVRPALQLLAGAGAGFAGPLEEFLKAHEHYRDGNAKDAVAWALKAFESTLKSICTERNWPFDPQKDTAKQLLDTVYANQLIPSYLQQHLGGLRSVLEAGIPTIRNKTSGHGQGPQPIKLPDHLVAFSLHLTASNIVFLIESHKAMP
jgi:hypothetical protein